MMLAFAIGRWAQLWMAAMERACWQGGAALLVAWIICRLWSSMPGRAQCWVWRLAYAKLLLALVWSAPVNLRLLPAVAEKPVATELVAVNHQPISFAATVVQLSAHSIISPAKERPIDWPAILFGTWALGVGLALSLTTWRIVSTIRLRRECHPIEDPQILLACEQIAGKLGIKRIPPILLSPSAVSPMLVGPFRPAIVLPAAALEQRRSRLELMLAHELAHYRRHDLLWNWPIALADLLLFFHPLVWLARRESRLAQELASDQLVLEMTQSAPSEYAQTLLSIALRKNGSRPPACAVGALTSRKSLHRRIVAMSRFSNWSSARWTVASAIVIALALLIIPPWRVVAADKGASPSATTNPSHAQPTAKDSGDGRTHPRPHMDGTSPHTIDLPGEIQAPTIILEPPVTGVLEKVDVHDGQSVKKGQFLFELDSRKAQADMRIAEATIQMAQSEVQRAKAGVAQNAVSKGEVETKMAKLEIAEANLDLAKLALDQMRIKAPFDGVVHTGVIAGQKVDGGTNIGELIQMDEMGVSVELPQSLVGHVKVGEAVKVLLNSDGHAIRAQVSSIAPVITAGMRTIGVHVRILEKNNRLLPGMFVNVSIEPAAADEKPDLKR